MCATSPPCRRDGLIALLRERRGALETEENLMYWGSLTATLCALKTSVAQNTASSVLCRVEALTPDGPCGGSSCRLGVPPRFASS